MLTKVEGRKEKKNLSSASTTLHRPESELYCTGNLKGETKQKDRPPSFGTEGLFNYSTKNNLALNTNQHDSPQSNVQWQGGNDLFEKKRREKRKEKKDIRNRFTIPHYKA